jgi:hypothetical protein
MHSKNNASTIIWISCVLILTLLISLAFYISRPQSLASARNSENQKTLPNQVMPASAPVAKIEPAVLSRIKNDIKVEITSAKVIPTGVEIGICYTTSDAGDWYPTPGHLLYSTYEIYPDEYEFTTEAKADGNHFGKRCALVRYTIDDPENITTPMQFSILDFEARPLEMYSACQNFQERLSTNPKAKAYGLSAKCTENNDGSIAVALADHNKSVSNDNAKQVLDSIASGVLDGPWEFTITQVEK